MQLITIYLDESMNEIVVCWRSVNWVTGGGKVFTRHFHRDGAGPILVVLCLGIEFDSQSTHISRKLWQFDVGP